MAAGEKMVMTNLHFGMQAFPAPVRVLWYDHLPGEVVWHGHEFSELVLVLGGRAIHETVDVTGKRRSLPVDRGSVLLLTVGEQHNYIVEKGQVLSVCNILYESRVPERLFRPDDPDDRDARLLREFPDRSADFRLGKALKLPEPLLTRLARSAEEIAENNIAGYGGTVSLLLLGKILAELGGFVAERYAGETAPGADAPVQTVLEYIHRHYAEEIPLSRLATLAICSPRHLSRQFRALTGETVGQYIRRLRISRACYLLRHSSLRNNRIALSVGYQEYAGFVRAFREELGMTPTEYRHAEIDDARAMQWYNRFF